MTQPSGPTGFIGRALVWLLAAPATALASPPAGPEAAALAEVPGLIASSGSLPVSLRVTASSPVSFNGLAGEASAGQSGAMLYPAYGVAGLIAAVATHAALVKSGESAEQARQREAAAAVIDPYRAGLADVSLQTLLDRAPPSPSATYRLVGETDGATTGWQVTLEPNFLLSKDQRVLILEAKVEASSPGGAPYANVLRVVSPPRPAAADPAPTATPEQTRHLIDDSATLLGHALDLLTQVLRDSPSDATRARRPERTVRYAEGERSRFERGVVLSESCERVAMQTLRGWLMSVPQVARPTDSACPAP